MALRALMKRKDINRLTKDLDALRKQAATFETREAELTKAIEEVETDEERAAVEDEVNNFESERDEVNGKITDLEGKIAGLEKELADLERAQETPEEPAGPAAPVNEDTNTRSEATIMNKRNLFAGMAMEQRTALFARDDVKGWLERVRTCIKEKRAIQGAGLLVPKVFLPLLRENMVEFSKLLKHVNLVQVSGEAIQNVMGLIPEGIWTDCCGKLNEADLDFYQDSVGCWKVAGYMAICNANLEDSDIDLASEILTALGQGLGYAADKAITFGLGTRMPLGIFTRLAQTAQPADYPEDARPWTDLHTSNIKTIAASKKGVELFAEIITAAGAAKGKYSRGEKVWIMNDTTYTALQAASLAVNSAGVIVSSVNGTMPVIGGIVEVLDFVPDNVILGGYLDLYLMAERAGVRLDQSEHVKFLDDQTVFRGTARYDGKPIIAEGFVAIGINGTTPSASGVTFKPDVANSDDSE